MGPRSRAQRAYPALLLLLVLCATTHADDSAPPIVAAPAEARNAASAEAAADAERNREHELDVAAGRKLVYIATFKDTVFGDNRADISVRINGEEVRDVLLHGSGGALTFIVPTPVVLNKHKRDRSVLEIFVRGKQWYKKLPVAAIALKLRKVDFDDFRRKHDPHFARAHNSSARAGAGAAFPRGKRDSASTAGARAERKLDNDFARFASLMEDLQSPGDDNRKVPVLQEEAARGNSYAQTNLAAILLSGDFPDVPQDFSRAVSLLRDAADIGNADAQALLAFLYASGVARPTVPKDAGMAIMLWEFAAEGGSLYGKIALAFRYFSGVDVAEDCERASLLYQEVAYNVLNQLAKRNKDNMSRAKSRGDIIDITPPVPSQIAAMGRTRLQEDIGPVFSREQQDLVQYYRHAARRGNADAQVVVGNLRYYGGAGMTQDLVAARQLFENAAGAGNIEAHAHLGFMDLRAGRNQSAIEHLTRAAERGNKIAHHGMGIVFMEGILVDRNPERAIMHFQKAAKKKVPESMYNLGMIYLEGQGVKPAPDKALEYFTQAAEHGHVKAHYMLGRMSLHGIVPAPADCAAASRSFKHVAERGMWNRILGRALRAYEGARRETARYRYLQAAHAGIEVAQYNAAYMYDRDLVESTEMTESERRVAYDEAFELYMMSAVQGSSEGSPQSMVRMGDMVYREQSDFEAAALVYEKAGKFKNAEALFNLGVMHTLGRGRGIDAHLAKRYFDMAKEADEKAILPASIAIFVLQYAASLRRMFSSCADFVTRWIMPWLHKGQVHEIMVRLRELQRRMLERPPSSDVLVLAALVAALAFVRQARVRLNGEEDDA